MFCSLLGKECKMWMKNILFYAYVIVLVMFYITQMDPTVIVEPFPDRDDYGMCYTTDETVIMERTLETLIMEYAQGKFSTYPVGFYKGVIPDEPAMQRIGAIISDLTGLQEKQWLNEAPVSVRKDLEFSEFKVQMAEVADLIGPGSSYTEEKLRQAEIPMTYEQAHREYEDVCRKDHVTGAYARLFCDYIGIILGILPAFFGVARVLRDKRSKAVQVIYTKAVSSATEISARYLAMALVMFVPVLLLSCFAMSQAVYNASAIGVAPDYLAYVKYSVVWLLPTILFVTALSYMIAELTENVLSVLLCCAIWFLAVFLNSSGSLTHAGWNLIPRFNALGSTELFFTMLPQLVKNRLFYSVVSLLLVAVIVFLHERKRKGGIRYGRAVR